MNSATLKLLPWARATLLAAALAAASGHAAEAVTDTSIRDAVKTELTLDPAIDASAVRVNVASGIVTLSGNVDNILAKERAVRQAQQVKGVSGVISRIDVVPSPGRSDADVLHDVQAALVADPATDALEIGVRVNGGKVMLSGTVDSWAERRIAETVAKSVLGVLAVENAVRVAVPEAGRADTEIVDDIRQRLRWDALVDDALIQITVDDGRVRLSGVVGSAAERTRAQSLAYVAGVEFVHADELVVARWARDPDLRKDKYVHKPDAQILAAVNRALLLDPRVLGYTVNPSVESGVVTLRGEVNDLAAKRAAERATRNVVGVVGVRNFVQVRAPLMRSDKEIAAKVRTALYRDARIDASDIETQVNHGILDLAGSVDSYYQKRWAENVAARVTGVSAIRNYLRVTDGPAMEPPYDPYVDVIGEPQLEPSPFPWTYARRTDEQILDGIRDQLFWSPFVDADEVDVSVQDGLVTLSGRVDSWTERQIALENAFEGGAVWVDNRIDVDPAS